MRTGNSGLPIPREAVLGFANCAGGFYGATRWASAELLSDDVSFPAHLANHTARGYAWLRAPESERERMLHFIFHLRVTMIYLSQHPIGKVTKSSTTDTAQMLVHLPKRAAFVKSGEDVGVIYTHPTPQRVEGQALASRQYFVQQQTRQTYCAPRAQIEQRVVSDSSTDPHSFARWEEADDATTVSPSPDVSGDADLRHSTAWDDTAPRRAVSAAPD